MRTFDPAVPKPSTCGMVRISSKLLVAGSKIRTPVGFWKPPMYTLPSGPAPRLRISPGAPPTSGCRSRWRPGRELRFRTEVSYAHCVPSAPATMRLGFAHPLKPVSSQTMSRGAVCVEYPVRAYSRVRRSSSPRPKFERWKYTYRPLGSTGEIALFTPVIAVDVGSRSPDPLISTVLTKDPAFVS